MIEISGIALIVGRKLTGGNDMKKRTVVICVVVACLVIFNLFLFRKETVTDEVTESYYYGRVGGETFVASHKASSLVPAMSAETNDFALDSAKEVNSYDIAVEQPEGAAYDNSDRYISYSGRFLVDTDEYDAYVAGLEECVQNLGGYIEDMNEDFRWYYNHDGEQAGKVRGMTVTVRVPAEDYDTVMEQLEMNHGELKHLAESAEDVTDEYIEMNTRIELLKDEKETFENMLLRAETVSDEIEIRDHLLDINAQLQSYEEQMERLKDSVDLATIRIIISERISRTEKYKQFASVLARALDAMLEEFTEDPMILAEIMTVGFLWITALVTVFVAVILIVRYKSNRAVKLVTMTQAEYEAGKRRKKGITPPSPDFMNPPVYGNNSPDMKK